MTKAKAVLLSAAILILTVLFPVATAFAHGSENEEPAIEVTESESDPAEVTSDIDGYDGGESEGEPNQPSTSTDVSDNTVLDTDQETTDGTGWYSDLIDILISTLNVTVNDCSVTVPTNQVVTNEPTESGNSTPVVQKPNANADSNSGYTVTPQYNSVSASNYYSGSTANTNAVTTRQSTAAAAGDSEKEETSSNQGLTPKGNLTLVDDYGVRNGEGQQFITLVTKSGNYFYLIIDRNEKGEETVHFLNLVDESDLFALMDDDSASDYQAQLAAEQAAKEAAEQAAAEAAAAREDETEKTESESGKEKKGSNILPILFIFLLIAAGGGGWFFIQVKKKKQNEHAPDPDAYYADDEEETEYTDVLESTGASNLFEEDINNGEDISNNGIEIPPLDPID